MNIKAPKFSFSLIRNFLISTFIPMALITIIIANAYNSGYTRDISSLTDTTLNTITKNLSTYLSELDQASLMPYYNEDFFTVLAQIRQKQSAPNTLDRIMLENTVGNMLSFSRYTRDDIVGALITSGQYSLFSSTSLIDCYIDPDYNFSETQWFRQAIEGMGSAVFIPPHSLDYYIPSGSSFSNPEVISVARAIVNLRTREPLCVIKIDANMTSFQDMFEEISWHVPSIILLTDENNHLIYSNGEVDPQAISRLSAADRQITNNGRVYYSYHKEEPTCRWNVYVLLDKASIRAKNYYIYLVAILLYLIGLSIATIVYTLYSRKMINTINTINSMINEIQAGRLHGQYHFASNNELQILIDSVTSITSLLEEKIDREYQLTIQQKDFQLKALQAQINPHFLFNTLNGLIALNQIGKNEELEHSLYSLTSMLRYTLKDESESTIEQEIHFLNDYCALQKLRFREKLNYSLNYEPSTAEVRIPKLLLQPLVENAIIHGIEPLRRPCLLSVDVIKYKNDEILITIEDDGTGFDLKNVKNHIGLANVENRILLLHPDNRFNMESIPNEGTIITIILKVHLS